MGRGAGDIARRWFGGLAAVALAVCLAPGAAIAGSGAGVPPSYGHDFVTIGAPGNRAMLPLERYWNLSFPHQYTNINQVGAVGYEFRIARTEVTSLQWRDFLNVAWPAWQSQGFNPSSNAFCGSNVGDVGVNTPVYFILPGRENWANRVSWRAAAMYCNWLHNGRPTDPNAPTSAFLSGAYDVSTFTRNPDGSYNDQVSRSPGAKYWIPSLDEWTKAGYYDANRYLKGNPGPTQNPSGGPPITGETSGYWLWPHATLTSPTSGQYHSLNANVGLHPDVISPWGVLDMIGTADEWTETVPLPPFRPSENRNRFVRGGPDAASAVNDDFFLNVGPDSWTAGLRIASLVPAPGSGLLIVVACVTTHGAARRARATPRNGGAPKA